MVCECGTIWANARPKALPDQRKPLNEERLHELALFYVGRFATTRAKLTAYLNRKLRERGWEGDAPPEVERLVERLAASGLDRRRALRTVEVALPDGARLRRGARAPVACARPESTRRMEWPRMSWRPRKPAAAALRFAPAAPHRALSRMSLPTGPAGERALAAMVRAGHGFELARAIVDAEPGSELGSWTNCKRKVVKSVSRHTDFC